MNEQILEIEADSFDQVRRELASRLPDGYEVISETVLSDGEPHTVTGYGENPEKALAMVQAQVPLGAEILEKKEKPASQELVARDVEAFNEAEARSAVLQGSRDASQASQTVQSVRLVMAGKTGFLGVGKKPNQYRVELLVSTPLSLSFTYRAKPKIRASLGERIVTPAYDPGYQTILTNCEQCRQHYQERVRETGSQTAPLADVSAYDPIWKPYLEEHAEGGAYGRVDFSGRLFASAKFKHHRFIGCDFSHTVWAFAGASDSDFRSCNFSEANVYIGFFERTNFGGCDFIKTVFSLFDFGSGNKFEAANFRDAAIITHASFFKQAASKKWAEFPNARMDGCKVNVKAEPNSPTRAQIQPILEAIFIPAQLAVMQIKYEGF